MQTLDRRQAMVAPPRSLAQRQEALKRANRIRFTRAEWKRDVKARRVNPLDVIADPPADFETMKIHDVLMAMPKVGRVKANKLLRLVRASPTKTLGGLSDRQRYELLSMLPGRPGVDR